MGKWEEAIEYFSIHKSDKRKEFEKYFSSELSFEDIQEDFDIELKRIEAENRFDRLFDS